MILDEETGRVNVEELNTLGSRQLVTRDVVRLSFPPFCTPSSLSPLFRRPILLFSPLPSPWFSPQTLILLHIYLYAPPSPHVFKVAPLWIMSHVHVCVFPLSIYTHVSLLSNKWILCWRGWRCLPELCFEARDTDEKIRKVQLVRIGFQLRVQSLFWLIIVHHIIRQVEFTRDIKILWSFNVWSYGKNSRGWMNECLYES